MKTIFFLFSTFLLIPFAIEYASASEYHSPSFGFTVQYPDEWDYDDELFIADGRIFVVGFYDNIEEYSTVLDIQIIEEKLTGRVGTDQQQLQLLSHIYQGYCDVSSYNVEGYICEDFEIEYARVLNFDTHKEYEIKTIWSSIYPDETYYDIINIIRVIPTNSGTWYLYSETYFDEDFSMLEEKIFSIMDSFTLPDSEIILKENSSLISPSGQYKNEKFNFSLISPQGWIVGEENLQVEGYVFPISFYNPNYKGLSNPAIMMLHTQTEKAELLTDNYSEKEFLEGFSQGFLEGFTEDGSTADIIFENMEGFDGYDKITLRLEATSLIDGVPFLQKFEVMSWIFENGDVFTLFFVSDVADFDENFPEFRKSVNSLKFGASEVDTEMSISVNIPDWIRNNAKWWAGNLINDSDFVAGLEYLINSGTIEVAPSSNNNSSGTAEIPSWIKSNAGWWAEEKISDRDFLKGVEFLIENGIINIESQETMIYDAM